MRDMQVLELPDGRSGVERISTNHSGVMSLEIVGSTPTAATTFDEMFYRPARWAA